MTTATASPARRLGVPPAPARRMSVEEYHCLIDAGWFAGDEKIELLDGWMMPKMSRNPPHDNTLRRFYEAFFEYKPSGWQVRIQMAITLREWDSEPEPDVVLAFGGESTFAARHPEPGDIGLVAEVADTSLAHDRGLKLGIYARAKLPTYWIVNLAEEIVEVYSDPAVTGDAATYRQRRDFRRGETIPLALRGTVVDVAVDRLLPPPPPARRRSAP